LGQLSGLADDVPVTAAVPIDERQPRPIQARDFSLGFVLDVADDDVAGYHSRIAARHGVRLTTLQAAGKDGEVQVQHTDMCQQGHSWRPRNGTCPASRA